ncbi:MAG TPA: hypothetical protein VE967_18790 [Gemmatimonadaceae bacterium]|nr:hypothetical protein [Gemmatimonadaceae bacterium]
MKGALEHAVSEELGKLGYDLVELKVGGSRVRPVFDVRIDRQDGQKVTIDDCTRASRAIEARLESEADVKEMRYVLEVSSPGIDRKLVRAQDWRRFVGRKVNLKTAALGRRADAEIIGIDGPEGSEVITVRDTTGVEHHVAMADVLEARLAVHWS